MNGLAMWMECHQEQSIRQQLVFARKPHFSVKWTAFKAATQARLTKKLATPQL
jgi:hypothetical protein